jgi:hypothetical protein
MTLVASHCSIQVTWFKGSVQVGTGSTIQATAGTYYAVCGTSSSNIITITNSGNCINTYFTKSRSANFSKNNCPATCAGTQVPFTKYYQSTINQLDVDTIAANDPLFNIDGQAYANLAGSCIGGTCTPNTYTNTKTLSFTKNNCPVTCSSVPVSFTRVYTSLISQSDANLQMTNGASQFNIDGQANANATGLCTGGNCSPLFTASRTTNFTKSNCPVGCNGVSFPFSRTYTSAISQLDADTQKANNLAQFNLDGQASANSQPQSTGCTGGSCAPCVSSWIPDTTNHTGSYCLNGDLVVDEMDSCFNNIKRVRIITFNDPICTISICVPITTAVITI